MAQDELIVMKKDDLVAAANALRERNGDDAKYSVPEIAEAIANAIVPPPLGS